MYFRLDFVCLYVFAGVVCFFCAWIGDWLTLCFSLLCWMVLDLVVEPCLHIALMRAWVVFVGHNMGLQFWVILGVYCLRLCVVVVCVWVGMLVVYLVELLFLVWVWVNFCCLVELSCL